MFHADYETRSVVDLKNEGLDRYAGSPTTRPISLAFAFDDEPVRVLPEDMLPRYTGEMERVFEYLARGGLFYAHNAQFEFNIWNRVCTRRYGWPAVRLEQMRCTQAMAFAMAMPGKLEQCARALGLPVQKDMEGHAVMLRVSRPRRVKAECELCHGARVYRGDACSCVTWWTDPERLQRVYTYNAQDVVVERELTKRLLPLSDDEQRVWMLDQRINARGIYVDTDACRGAVRLVDDEKARLNTALAEATSGAVSSFTQTGQLRAWMEAQGVTVSSVAKDVVSTLLEGSAGLPPTVAQALRIRQEAGKSSVAKIDAMLSRVSPYDQMLRFLLMYHVASTGRFGGRGVQPQNFPRGKLKPASVSIILDVLGDVARGRCTPEKARHFIESVYGPLLDVLPSCLRGFLTARPGHDLIAVDYSNIEGRGLAYLAGDENKLDAFRAQDEKKGPDVYLVAASRIFGVDPNSLHKESDERQIGKVSELALGYEGGVNAFVTMGVTYNVKEELLASALPSVLGGAEVEDRERAMNWWEKYGFRSGMRYEAWLACDLIKRAWRRAHPAIVQYWADLDAAAVEAVDTGKRTRAGAEGRQVQFQMHEQHLFCLLPSGRVLTYPYAHLRQTKTPWGGERMAVRYMGVDAETKQWIGQYIYGGKWAENVTQAFCRDILVDGMTRLERDERTIDYGFQTIFHVHDEIVGELPSSADRDALPHISNLLSQGAPFTRGMPIVAAGWRRPRYGK